MGKSIWGSSTMRTSLISFGFLLLVPAILADSFASEKVKVGKKTCTCSFTFVLNGDRVNVKNSLVSCDKKCSGATPLPPTGGNGTGGASGDCKCGLAQRSTRIVGGVETEVNEWPWQAGMVWSGSSSVFCGATVISDEWILTASHCVDGTNPAEIQVLLGEHDYWDSDEPVRMDISEIIMHPDYNSNTVDQDFALLRMANKIDWASNPNIRPACLPEYTAGDYDQWMSTVTGWGTTSSGGSTSNVLLEVDVKVISNSECNGAYGGITNNMLCAADASGNGGSDACQGDSGGPLVACGPDGNCGTAAGMNYDLIGVVSFGIGCAQADFPGVYARVTAARQWIDDNAPGWESGSCPRV